MAGVSCARETRKAEDVITNDLDALRRDRNKLPIQLVECLAVDPAGACLEPGRIDEVRSADCGNVNLEIWTFADKGTGCSGVVEVDVGEKQVVDVTELEPAFSQTILESRDARRGTAVEQAETIFRLDDVAPDGALVALVQEVDRCR